MGNLHLVTGYQGTEHVTAADHGSLYAAIFGSGSYVLDRGNKLAATVVTNNQIRIADGDIILQGRHIRLNEGATVNLTIENGAQGYYRNDLICVRYTRNSGTGVEEASLVVIKGAAMTASPSDPDYNNGDLLTDNAETVDFPLYRVPLSGITVQPLVALFKIIPAYGEGGLDYVPNDEKGKAGGVATLDSSGKVPSGQLPSMNYIPTSQKGAASGVAPLNESKKVGLANLPVSDSVYGGTSTIATSVAVKTAYDKAVAAQNTANGAATVTSGTPVVSRNTTNGGTPTLEAGKWQRVGDMVTVSMKVTLTSNTYKDRYVFNLSGVPAPLGGVVTLVLSEDIEGGQQYSAVYNGTYLIAWKNGQQYDTSETTRLYTSFSYIAAS